MSPLNALLGNIRMTQEYELELMQEEYQQYYEQRVKELSRIDEAKHFVELLKAQRKLDDSQQQLDHTREFVASVDRLKSYEKTLHAQEVAYKDAILRRGFSGEFHDALADSITMHPETLASLLNKVDYADLESDIMTRILANIEAYLCVMSYLNNFDFKTFGQVGEGEVHPDLETFNTHREYGVQKATKLGAYIRDLLQRRFVLPTEQTEVVNRWQEIEFPVKDITGTVHRKVKRTQGNF